MKRKLLLVGGTLLLALSIDRASAQNSVGIGTKDPNPNAVLELVSPNHNQGLLVPRMTTAQRIATSFVGSLSASDRGLMVFDSEENSFYFWNGSGWALMDSPEIPQDLELNGTTLTITNNDNATAISLAPFLGTNTDEQTLSLAGTTLGISNGNNVDLSILQDGFEPNTDNQTLNFVGTSLSISGGNSVNLASLDTDTDNQTLNLAGNVLSISGGNNVNLSSVNSDNQTLNLAAGTLSISGGNSVNLNSIDTDDQTLNLVGSNLSIAGGNTVNLSSIDTDDQTLNLVGSNLSISEGNTIDISSIDTKLTEAEVDAFVANNGFLTAEVDGSITNEIQDLNLAGNILTITNNPMATPIDLSPFSGTNTDNQTLSLAGGNLSITGGNTIDISSIDTDTDTDDQTLSLAGSTLSIADGNSVNLSSINTDNQNLNLVGSNLSISGGNTIDISSVDTNLTEAEVDAFVSNNGFLTAEVDGSITNEIQDLSLVGNILSITNNALATPIDLSPFSGTNTDNQTLSLAGGNLSITGGNTIDISSIDTDTDTDDQTLSLAGSTLSIADGNSVNLSSINTDNQTLSYGSGIIAISGGNNVNISAVNTDNQNLNLVGSNLSISGGNTIDISSVDTNLTEAEVDAFVSNNGFLTAEVDGSITNEIQDISTTGAAGNISIAGGSTLTLNVNDADASSTNEIQDLTFNAGVIALSNDPGNTTIDLSGYDNNALDDFDGDFGSLLNIPAGIADGDDVGITSVNSNATLNGNGAGTPLGVNVGTGANQIVQLNAAAQLPAVDGSLLTNLPGITTVNSNTTLNGNGAGIPLGVNVGTGANQIVQLNAASQLPAVDGSLLTNLPGITSVNTNTTLTGNGAGTPLGVNVGTGANQIVQLNASGQLPAVNGSLLTGLPTSPWTGSPNISYSGGNVGVGTNNPFNAMAVSGTFNTASTSDGIFLDVQNISGTIGALSGIRFKKNGVTANQRYNSGIFYNGDDLMLSVKSNATATNVSTSDAALTLNNQGNVGIGTTTPQRKLHIVDAVADVSGVDGAFIDIQNTNSSQASLSGIRFKNNTSLGTNAYKAGILFQRGGLDANSGGFGNLIFAINNEDNQNNFTAANERFSISSSGASVTGQLSVSGFFSVGQSSTFSGDVSVGGRLSVSDEFRAGASGSGIAGYLLRSNGSNTAPTWTPSIWDVTFGSVDNIYYSSSIGAARLGLGTSSPSTFLDIEHGNSLTPGLEINATATTNEESSIRMITADNTFTVGVNDVGTFVVRDGTNVNTSGSERLTITNTGVTRIVGNVGVGPAAPVPNVAMDVAGSIEYTGTITDVSDRRLKKNIEPLVNSLERILDVEGVSFEMKDENLGRGVELGVIAQELEIIFPELVFEDEKGFKSVNYIGLIAPMIEALKAQQKTIDSQQKTIAQLNESGKDLEQIVEKQQIEMDEMLVQINQIKQLLQMEAKSTAKK